MNKDKRMYFVRNMEALEDKSTAKGASETEYEVVVDSRFIGGCEFGPYKLLIWDFNNSRPGEERSLCFVTREASFTPDDMDWKNKTKKGFYHGGYIGEELIALASLFFRRRFKLGPIIRRDNTPTRLTLKGDMWNDQEIIKGERNLGDLSDWLKKVAKLDSQYHFKYILSVRLYHRALDIIETQPDIAYLNLISAIEVLCQDEDIGELTISDLECKPLEDAINKIEDKNLKEKIKEGIFRKLPFIKRRFVNFIISHIEKSFWEESKAPEYEKVKEGDLERLLKNIYDQRSAFLHSGEPFMPDIFNPPQVAFDGNKNMLIPELPFGLAIGAIDRKWEQKDYIPYPHFFERLVNHVLRVFLECHLVRRSKKSKEKTSK